MTIWSILLLLKIFYGHLVYFLVIWYIFPRLGSFSMAVGAFMYKDMYIYLKLNLHRFPKHSRQRGGSEADPEVRGRRKGRRGRQEGEGGAAEVRQMSADAGQPRKISLLILILFV
jgi:hypothetical protein